MKKQTFMAWPKLCTAVLLGAAVMFTTSCAKDGFDNDESFESSAKGIANLQSPSASDIKVTASADGQSMTIAWPVVMGAGGYQLTLYNVNDVDNPAVILDKVVDGCSVASVPREEDTNYKLILKTIGNASLGNGGALEATNYSFTTFTTKYKDIPSDVELSAWFAANPVPAASSEEWKTWRAENKVETDTVYYDLEAGGSYKLNALLDFKGHKVVLRTGSKTNPATVTLGTAGAFASDNSFGLKYITFNCATSTQPFFSLSEEPTYSPDADHNNHYIINDPIAFASCTFNDVTSYFMYDNEKKYCPAAVLVNNCVVKLASAESMATGAVFQMYNGGGFICNITLQNSTFWNSTSNDQKYFIRYANAGRADRAGFSSSSINMINTTFYKIAYKGQMCNHSGFDGDKYTNYNITKNIFVDCGSNQVARRIIGRVGTGEIVFNYNTYVYDDAIGTDQSGYDTGTILTTDPGFADADNGDFTVSGSEQLTYKTGDLRWIK